jgi:hypothetical protein
MVSVAPIASILTIRKQRVVFRNITWQAYQQLLDILGDRRSAISRVDEVLAELDLRSWVRETISSDK